jgi:DNA replication protein DnaC
MTNTPSNQPKVEIPDMIKAIKSHQNYPSIWTFLQDKGNELYGKNFRLSADDAETIVKLICYFVKDETVAEQMAIDLERGIMLSGPIGCGKTSLMNICRFLLPADQRHTIKTCRDMAFEFAKAGNDFLYQYTRGSFRQSRHEPKTYCFDDLGTETTLSTSAGQYSIMAEILLSRYELFHTYELITHITTNLNSHEIEVKYGQRLGSRCRDMFNQITFPKNTTDKRK